MIEYRTEKLFLLYLNVFILILYPLTEYGTFWQINAQDLS